MQVEEDVAQPEWNDPQHPESARFSASRSFAVTSVPCAALVKSIVSGRHVALVVSGAMTKDITGLIGPQQPFQNTQDCLSKIDGNLQKAMG